MSYLETLYRPQELSDWPTATLRERNQLTVLKQIVFTSMEVIVSSRIVELTLGSNG
ncbi:MULTISPECIES: hypothetical protein [Moorena]|uniref:hypothetical protein n=1 Tax=Moorena TaxID=1155738 RepID=UPI0013012A0C|nr:MULTISPECIES: hypothetical protein [Moorena]NEO25127.1 hypothetical protein [Moorena sp. SIO4A5]